MRLNSVRQIVLLLAAVHVLGLIIQHREQNPREQKRAHTPHVVGDASQALQSPFGRSFSAPGSPANLRFTHLSVADGLTSGAGAVISYVTSFGKWLGGLNRYDGYTFKVYKHDAQDDRSLGCDSIWALYVDRAGVLWVGTAEGVDRYDRDTDSFCSLSPSRG